MKPINRRKSRGIAIPVVLTFVIVLLVFGFTILRSRTAVKFSNLLNFHYLKANMMAEAGIQHAMMKIRLCPDEAFEAAARQFGICPMNDEAAGGSPGGGQTDLMETFISDIRCDDLGGADTSGWGYRITRVDTKAAFRKANRLVTVVEITSEGWAVEGRGGLQTRREIVKKTVSITKNS